MDPITEDPPRTKGKRPALTRLFVEDRVLGMLITPGGKGPHPLCVLCHGFPGHETNMDVAHSLVRAGFAAALFHYSGSWGSKGDFSFGGMVRDIRDVVGHLKGRSHHYRLDPERMALIGYSMGGWASMMMADKDPTIGNLVFQAGFNLGLLREFARISPLNRRLVLRTLRQAMPSLSGCDPHGLLDEVLENGRDYDLIGHAASLSDRSLMMIYGTRDRTSVPRLHHEPLKKALIDAGAEDLKEVGLVTDHSFLGKRIALQRCIVDRVVEKIGGPGHT